MSEPLLRERRSPAAVLTLNRPDKRNALNTALLDALDESLAELDSDPEIRGIVLTGGTASFSAGADLNEALAVASLPGTLRFLERFRRVNARIEGLSKPVLAAINGHCLTGGLELALCCDVRIAGEGARFGVTSARIGSLAGAGAPQRLSRLIGTAWTKDLLFSGRVIDAATALRIGLVGEVVGDAEVLDVALARIEAYARSAPLSVWFAKLAVNAGRGMDLDPALRLRSPAHRRPVRHRRPARGDGRVPGQARPHVQGQVGRRRLCDRPCAVRGPPARPRGRDARAPRKAVT